MPHAFFFSRIDDVPRPHLLSSQTSPSYFVRALCGRQLYSILGIIPRRLRGLIAIWVSWDRFHILMAIIGAGKSEATPRKKVALLFESSSIEYDRGFVTSRTREWNARADELYPRFILITYKVVDVAESCVSLGCHAASYCTTGLLACIYMRASGG
jgi:hypothetical protein